MSTPNINVLLTSTLSNYDNLVANTPLLASLNPGSLAFNATAYFYNEYFQTAGAVSLPLATCYVLWVRNRDTVNSINVGPTTALGLQQVTIDPGGFFLLFNPNKTNGFTALNLAGIPGSALCELYVAG